MPFLVLPALSLLLMVMFGCAFLPFLAVRERALSARRKRSAYDKSAMQIVRLGFLLSMALALLLGADLLLNGFLDRAARGALRPLWLMQAAGWAGTALLCLLGQRIWIRGGPGQKRMGPGSACLMLSGLAGLAAAWAMSALLWLYLRGASANADVLQSGELYALARMMVQGGGLPRVLLFLLSGPLSGLAAAQGLCLIWYVIRRKHDDFGRDYYTQMLAGHARQAALCGGLLLPLTLGIIALNPEIPAAALSRVWPFTESLGMPVVNAAVACLPLALICWQALGRAALPLQKKFLIFPPLPLLWIWFLSLLARLCL